MATARDLITRTLKLMKVVGEGQSPSDEQADDMLDTLNDMIESWSLSESMIYTETKEEFTLTANDGDYTIGSSGNFNTTRPTSIIAMTIRLSPNDETVVEPMSAEEYANITSLSVSGRPKYYWYDKNYPLGLIRFDCLPDSAYTMSLTSLKQWATISTLDDVLSVPVGAMRMLRYNLAVEAADEFGVAIGDNVRLIASDSKRAFMANSMSQRFTRSSLDTAITSYQPSNIWTRR